MRTPNSSTPWVIHCQTSVHTANQQRGGRGRDPGQVRAWSLPRNDDDQPKILPNKKKLSIIPQFVPFGSPLSLSLSLAMSPPGGPGTGSWMTDNGDGDQIQNLERTRHESGQRQKFNFVKHQRFFGLTSSNQVLHQGESGGLGLVPGPREI